MDYLKSISLKSITLALLAGHFAPYMLLTVYSIIVTNLDDGFHSIAIGVIVMGWLFIFGPLITGYIGAKYSQRLPMLNGMLATSLGVILYFTHGSFNFIYFAIGFICLSLLLGFIGAKKYVLQN